MTGSYGILNVNPVGEMLPQKPNFIDQAMKSATGMYDLFGKHYENKLKNSQANMSELETQQKASTLPGLIESINAKSAADTKFYPLQQEANLGHTRAQIEEQFTKAGLNRAESKAAAARAIESYAGANLKNTTAKYTGLGKDGAVLEAYNKSAPGTPENIYYGALLNKEMGAYAPLGSGAGAAQSVAQTQTQAQEQKTPSFAQPGPGGGVPYKLPSAIAQQSQQQQGNPGFTGFGAGISPQISGIKDPRFGGKYGQGGTYINSEGKEISTPTNSVATQNQKTIMANERVKPLIQDLIKNNSQFQTAKQKGALELQRVGNYLGGNYELPNQFAQGQQDLKLAPESLLKGYGLNVTNESLQTMEKALEPIRGETQKGYESRMYRTLDQIQKNQQQAMNAQSQGFDVTPQKPQAAAGFDGNPNLPPDQQAGQNQVQDTKTIDGSEYVQINGAWYHK